MQVLKRPILALALLAVAGSAIANKPNIFAEGAKAENVHHVGDVWLGHASRADETYDYNIAVAKFAPGARLDWHLHPAGQQLIVVEGTGYYQERNAPVQIVRKGDVVKCTPGVEHWHAATPDSGVTYIAITGNEPTQWLEPVDAEMYLNVGSGNPDH